MQTVTAGHVGRVSRGTGIERASRRRRPRRMSKRKSRGFEHTCKRDTMTYDNRTEGIQLSQGTTYRVQQCRVARTGKLSEWELDSICNYSACPHEGEEDGGANMKQGCIQPSPNREWQQVRG